MGITLLPSAARFSVQQFPRKRVRHEKYERHYQSIDRGGLDYGAAYKKRAHYRTPRFRLARYRLQRSASRYSLTDTGACHGQNRYSRAYRGTSHYKRYWIH
jgi:hypothetical protein